MSVGVAWLGLYLVCLAAFVALGLRDPDTERRSSTWSMTGTFAGLAVVAALRTLLTGQWFAAGPGIAAWLIVSALLACAGRPTRLATGTALDPVDEAVTEVDGRTARRARLLTIIIFFGGLVLVALARPSSFGL